MVCGHLGSFGKYYSIPTPVPKSIAVTNLEAILVGDIFMLDVRSPKFTLSSAIIHADSNF